MLGKSKFEGNGPCDFAFNITKLASNQITGTHDAPSHKPPGYYMGTRDTPRHLDIGPGTRPRLKALS